MAWCVLPASQPHLSCRGLLLATTAIFACYSNMCDPCGLLREAVKVHVWKGVIFFPCSALRLSVVHQLMSVWPAGAVSDPQSSITRKLGRWVAACLRWFKSREAAVNYFNHKVISSNFRPGVKFPNWKNTSCGSLEMYIYTRKCLCMIHFGKISKSIVVRLCPQLSASVW